MIKTFILHQLFDKCIDIIFKGFKKAFSIPKNRYTKFNPSKYYSYLVLKEGEDSLTISDGRPRSGERRVWKINTKIMPKPKAEEHMRKMVKKMRRKINYDVATGKIK